MAVFRPQIVLAITGVIALLILFSLAQEANRRWQIQREVSRLEQEVSDMEKSLVALQQLNEYFRTPDYKERLAREQLNFRAPGEKVVLIPERSGVPVATTKATQEQKVVSIPLRWWYLFFVDSSTK
ncbi:MAG: hypothetical protein A3C02_01550 [Candidatus Andersenbacteria bacterium RIFCSPHIGHO2_02_FULL_45_11]|uniref:Septum formation initiator n=1 Tax=Candidatus Andersenbacteria bacterium RIFCSPHIGHO2_12_FULL_45_11 TaxID=1797281 RepID=A0A1G1X248_9BACT|nr:MAG: hypothetical protein A2805_02270 [Candidatus Andersenbacteria bacterium RIFCSPHIGHO2_01_FULL_46_36]OGY32747.1 MAG: hypothetical protein A3C02_01550 [Candidatus Andersenbacteria bacterium RIFCSPHIGHO2_02_FULL_45_11]OGY34079.1 MAG: hypothetical protein A3D99_02395 [Candidatus Andersenbacteria bacterium RIFCSPHIGHO2_12_FULL_45_11]